MRCGRIFFARRGALNHKLLPRELSTCRRSGDVEWTLAIWSFVIVPHCLATACSKQQHSLGPVLRDTKHALDATRRAIARWFDWCRGISSRDHHLDPAELIPRVLYSSESTLVRLYWVYLACQRTIHVHARCVHSGGAGNPPRVSKWIYGNLIGCTEYYI